MSAAQVVTLGCRLNHAESALIASRLDGSDIAVVNTCAVTQQAMRDSRRAVRRLAAQGLRVVATGCAATIDPFDFARIADAVVPNPRKLDRGAFGEGIAPEASPRADAAHTRAFVPVQTGCDHACTFCIIPQGRGASVSRPAAEIIAEVRALAERGVGEVVLTGVDLTSYAAPGLGALVAAILAQVPALPRLRLSSLDGVEIDRLLFDLIVGEPRVMPHIHLSLQAGDDLVLKRMKRRHSRAQAIALVERLKTERPEIAIGADIIAGFPTESEAAHAANLSLIDACDIVHGHVFPYSPRPGTPAARMPQVDAATIRSRAAELREAVAQRRSRWLGALVGTRHAVLSERDGTGHAPNFARFRSPAGARPGGILSLRATGIEGGLLLGAPA
jgi:threonylcarbamoyladenosine tRNA methylthiotransferase MtaB